jgi:glycosyltransferase involved in cell wall biosynthesis
LNKETCVYSAANAEFKVSNEEIEDEATTCDLSVVIPAKNEEARLLGTLQQIIHRLGTLGVSYEIIVVNDGSHDKTAKLAKLCGARVVNHLRSKGIAAAFRSGARVSRGEAVMLCPADISDFSFLAEAAKGSQLFDVVSVSKRHPRSVVVGYDRWRWFLSNGYQRCIQSLFGKSEICTDTHYVKLYNRRVLRDILNKCTLDGPVGETEIMLYARDAGYTFFEVPARIVHDGNGSKMSFALILQTVNELLRLYLHRRLIASQLT